MKAIVYSSKTGFTEKYAHLLSELIGIPAYSLKNASRNLSKDDRVIFMGWLMANTVKGYSKASARYDMPVVCVTGLSNPTEDLVNGVISGNKLKNTEVFYLRGGFDKSRLGVFSKFIMNFFAKSLEKKKVQTESDIEMIRLIKYGADFVSQEALAPVVMWYGQNKLESF